jgi:Spy/CpxP family protein refolding chaperone
MQKFSRRWMWSLVAGVMLSALPAIAQQGQDESKPQPQDEGQKPGRWARRAQQRRGQNHMAMLAQKLNLTDAQKQQFQQINQDMRKQAMAVHNDSSLSDEQKKEKMQELRKQAHKQMFDVLTPEQREQLKQMREQRQKDGGKGPGGQASGKKPDKGDDDPFAGMTSDDDDGPGSGS